MKTVLPIILLVMFVFNEANSQTTQFKYDNHNRIINVSYENQKQINYAYDKNGNRISQITSTITTAVSNLNDSLLQANNGVFIYPNPSNGNFKSRIYSSQKQQVTVQIYTIDGKLIHTYSAEALKGYYDINININPKPIPGTYIVTVKGKTIDASKKILIME
ncbi:MAG: T9SS type A sorting domain-containing protein [Chitinophagaceae bacterium]|nr:T9SS type A sorting domain-containing protein [Chitinophagaceae bacterium]